MGLPDTKGVILVLDRDPSSSRAISRIMKPSNAEVCSLGTHHDLLTWLNSHSQLPHRGCLVFDVEFGEILHSAPWGKRLVQMPKIGMGRAGKLSHVLTSIQVGLFEFVEKPFRLENMKTTIELALTSQHEVRTPPALHALSPSDLQKLTPREQEILSLMEQGFTGKEISASLGISVKTYYIHRANALSKTGIKLTHRFVPGAAMQKLSSVS